MRHAILTTLLFTIGLGCGTPLLAGDAGVTDAEILVGSSAVLSGPLGPQTANYTVGSGLYFDAVNAAGGVHGRKIVYKPLDDGFDVKRTADNTRKLVLEDKVFLVYNSTGIANTVAVVYQDDGFGNALMGEVKRAAEAGKLAISTFVKIDPKQPDFWGRCRPPRPARWSTASRWSAPMW